ncbi:MAG: hypothetical protein JNL22_01855 [Bacteroidales bacterium]|nr:hypothetical protein [Bacteroidales bacterium]
MKRKLTRLPKGCSGSNNKHAFKKLHNARITMKEYFPAPLLKIPRWLETIIQFFLFLIIVVAFHKLGLRGLSQEISNIEFIISIIIFSIYKVFGTFTAVDLITIDYFNKQIRFEYWFMYFIKKHTLIKFEDLDFKFRNDILLLGGTYGLYIFNGRKLKIKLNRMNGWKDQQIDSLIDDLLTIKQPSQPIIKRKTIFD